MSKEVNKKEDKDKDIEELARFAVDIASDSFASDILLLNISNKSSFADFMIILTVDSSRQMGAVVDDLEVGLKSKGIIKFRKEGESDSGWVSASRNMALRNRKSNLIRSLHAKQGCGVLPLSYSRQK